MTTARNYSFMRRPVWVVGHVVALVAIVGFILLGRWQLQRHDDRQLLDSLLEDRLDTAPVALEALLDSDTINPGRAEFRRITAQGTYMADDEVILQARSFEGVSGHEVLTPLLLEDGTAVVVDRGWVPIDVAGPPVVGAEPPGDVVAVSGFARLTQVRGSFGPVDSGGGVLDRISRVDLDRLQDQIDVPLRPIWVQLETQDPPQRELPRIVDPPQLGGGPPHLAYAVQWFAFAGVVAIAYPLLMRRTARRGIGRT